MALDYSTYQNGLALNVSIATQGAFPFRGDQDGGTEATLATIHTYAFSGFGGARGGVPAQGQTVAIRSNTALFSLLGVNYGGDGQSTFSLPDFAGRAASYQGGQDNHYVGDSYGAPAISLETYNLPGSLGGFQLPLDTAQPSLATTFAINANGVFPGGAPTYDTIGMIAQFAGTFPPGSSVPCDGRELSIDQYGALFAVIGTTYGGDGVTTFCVPDLRGRTIVGTDGDHPLGEVTGSDTISVTQANLPVNMGGSGVPVTTEGPQIALRYLVVTEGLYPSYDSTDTDTSMPYLGEVLIYAGQYMPDDFVEARGQTLSINTNQALFSLLGTTFGGNGQTTFQLPDLQGRAIVGEGSGTHGLPPLVMGEIIGADGFTISSADFGALTLYGSSFADVRYGADQADSISGLGGDDFLVGNNGNDVLRGGAGADTLNGGAGSDTASYDDSTVSVVVDLALNTGRGGDAEGDGYFGIENLTGGSRKDFLIGDAGNNILTGNDGNDELTGGAGADALVGGAGVDTASYAGAASAVTVNLANPLLNMGDAAGDTFSSIEVVIGSAGNDTITGDDAVNYLTGGGGADTIRGGGGADRIEITGAIGLVDGGAGSDVLRLTANSATAFVFNAANLISVETVTVVSADISADFSALSTGLRLGSIGSGATIHATQAADIISGGQGADTLFGDGGNDRFNIVSTASVIDGGIGTDTVTLGGDGLRYGFTDATFANVERVDVGSGITADFGGVTAGLFVTSLGAAGTVTTVIGSAGLDRVFGGSGTDIIVGGMGADAMRGGAGADYFAYRSLAEMSGTGTTYDRILDFDARQGDKIDLSAIDADPDAIGMQSFTFIGAAAFSGHGDSYELRAIDRGNGTYTLAFDTDHDRRPDFSFSVQSDGGALTADDFLLGGPGTPAVMSAPAATVEQTMVMPAFVADETTPSMTSGHHVLPMPLADGICIV